MISRRTINLIMIGSLILTFNPLFSQVISQDQLMAQTINLFKSGLYDQAVAGFKGIINDPKLFAYHGDAYFWISKSYLALGNLNKTATFLEYFLSNYRNNPNYIEGVYQKGRLLFLQNDFENSIKILKEFIEKFPDSAYVSNGYFWVGESLYNLGKLDDALIVFKNIVQNYPNSYKYEAANYKMSIIEFKKRENELLKLLKWSHLEALRNYDEFKQREAMYEQAIASYQKKLGSLEAGKLNIDPGLYNTELDRKNAEIERLKAELESLKLEIEALKKSGKTTDMNAVPSSSDDELLKVKKDALEVQKELLEIYSKELEKTK